MVDTEGASYLDSFTYEVPEDLRESVGVGACVLVPFGSALVPAYVVAVEEIPSISKVKPIFAAVDSPITLVPELIELGSWLSGRYICGLSRCTHSVLPGVVQCRVRTMIEAAEDAHAESPVLAAILDAGGSVSLDALKTRVPNAAHELRKLERAGAVARRYELVAPEGKTRTAVGVALAISADRVQAEASKLRSTRSPRQAEVLEYVAARGPAACSGIAADLGPCAGVVSALISKGLLRRVSIVQRRTPAHTPIPSTSHFRLTPDQQSALDAAVEAVSVRRHGVILAHGVTASGKTEVYLRAIEHAASLGLRSLVLLPEISLTTQVLNIFRVRFGDRVAVLHSGLSAGERFDEWVRAQQGDVDVVLGARSAVFAPIPDLGLVIVDEEHEPSYKQDSDPRYHGRDTAIHRAEQSGALALLGSATPSVESYFLARSGKYRLVVMRERVERRPMPAVSVADLREEYQKGRATIFTAKLADAIARRLANRQQVILFQNRRAYATFLLCRECGFTARCPNCAVSLKLHAADRVLRCHHCDHEQSAPTVCPKCGGRKIGKFGIGTERIEEEARAAFSSARVLRMDKDTTARRGSHGSILDAFRRREADILVGTQMIAKGLDFPGVTLVGVISADTALSLPDFRAGERTFQLLSQVSGRAGRGPEPGEVVIQTFNPEHYAVVSAVEHDYEGFYEQETALREEHGFPPFGSLVNIVAADASEADARRRLHELVGVLNEKIAGGASVDLLGPSPAPVARLRGKYRWHVVVRSPDRDHLLRVVRDALDALPSVRRAVVVDVDPISML